MEAAVERIRRKLLGELLPLALVLLAATMR